MTDKIVARLSAEGLSEQRLQEVYLLLEYSLATDGLLELASTKDTEETRRVAVIDVLRAMEVEAGIPVLTDIVCNEDYKYWSDNPVHINAAHTLAALNANSAIDPLVKKLRTLHSDAQGIRKAIALALGELLDDDEVRTAAAKWDDSVDQDRIGRGYNQQTADGKFWGYLAAALKKIKAKSAYPDLDYFLTHMTHNNYKDIKHYGKEAVGPLLERIKWLAEHNGYTGNEQSALALIMDRDDNAVIDAILELVREDKLQISSRHSAYEILGNSGRNDVVDVLIDELEQLPDKQFSQRRAVYEALGKTRHPRAISVLLDGLKSDTEPTTVTTILTSLKKVPDKKMAQQLVEVAYSLEPHPDSRTFGLVVNAIADLKYVDGLIDLLQNHENPIIREFAIYGLESRGSLSEKALNALTAALDDENELIRKYAQNALDRLH